MINNLHFEGYDKTSKSIIVDVAELEGRKGWYEAMVMRPDGTELDSYRSSDLEVITRIYNEMVAEYTVPDTRKPLTGRYAQLRADLKKALMMGRTAEAEEDHDGGTCNMDALAIFLPRWIEAKVMQAAEEAGTSCYFINRYGGKLFIFQPDSNGQADKRAANAEAMAKAMKQLGYDAFDYCVTD